MSVETPVKLKPLSEVTMMVVDNGLFPDLAIRLAKDCKKMYYTCPGGIQSGFPRMNNAEVGRGIDELEVVHSVFGPWFDAIDLFCFPDIYFGPLQLHLESLGKAVWGSRMGENLELSRNGTKELMKKLGMPVGPYEVVKGMDALREYLRSHKQTWVKINTWRGTFETFKSEDYASIEPKLDEVEYALGKFKYDLEFICEADLPDKVEVGTDLYTVDGKYPSITLAGIEVKDRSFAGLIKKFKDFPEPVTRWNTVMAPVLKNYGYRGFLSTEVRIGKDHKPFMIDACFDSETEVLTERGWRLFKDCTLEDRMATLNTTTRQIQYQAPERIVAREYTGDMVQITNCKGTIECLVTPDHDVLRTDRSKQGLFKERAALLTDKGFIPRTGRWVGDPSGFFELPAAHHEWDFYGGRREVPYKICRRVAHEDAKRILMDDWVAFMAWYLSEGSLSGSKKSRPGAKQVVQISQSKYPDAVRAVLNRLPFKYTYKNNMFRICSAQLGAYLFQFGHSATKFVPDYIKRADSGVIRVFLDNYCLGDGSERDGQKTYYTTSRRMIDDLQELIFKVGSVGNIITRAAKGTEMSVRGGKTYIRNHDSLVIQERTGFTDFWFETKCRKEQYITHVPYSGMVYCATVPNGTLYVRRHDKPFWSGNCARAGSPPNELYQQMYTNIADIVYKGANGILIDPTPAAKFGVEVLIHSSWADKNWQPIEFPSSLRDYIKLRNVTKIKGRYYVIPQSVGLPEIGAVLGMGRTLDEAIQQAKEIAKQVKGYYIEVPTDALDEAEAEMEKSAAIGLKLF